MIAKKIITFGSCMSEGVFASMTRLLPDFKWSYLNHVIHNRSDYFIDAHISKKQIPVDSVDVFDANNDSSNEFPNVSLIREGLKFVANQNDKTIGLNGISERSSFLKNLLTQSVDIILLDNFMDIASMLVQDKITNKRFFIHSASYTQELFIKRFAYTGFLDPIQSIDNFKIIINWLKVMQPNASIYFLPFPSLVNAHENRDSVVRAAKFKQLLVKNPLSVPMIDTPVVLERHMLALDDWCHYSPCYYDLVVNQLLIT